MAFHIVILFLIFIILICKSDAFSNNYQQVSEAVVQDYGIAKQIDSIRYIQFSTTTAAQDDFCRKYLESCPSDTGNSPSINSQPSNDNFANQFERKYMEKDTNNQTVASQQQSPIPGGTTNETFTNETLSVPQQTPPAPSQPPMTPPVALPPTL